MKDRDIIEELEKLKLKILFEGVEKTQTDFEGVEKTQTYLEKYNSWLDEIMGRKIGYCQWEKWRIFEPREYARCKTIASLVQDLYHKKHSGKKKYHENEPEIAQIVQEVVFMTMFTNKELNET